MSRFPTDIYFCLSRFPNKLNLYYITEYKTIPYGLDTSAPEIFVDLKMGKLDRHRRLDL